MHGICFAGALFLTGVAVVVAWGGATSPPLEPHLTRNLNEACEQARQGRFKRAYIHYRKALALDGDNAEAVYGVDKIGTFLKLEEIPKGERASWMMTRFPKYENDPDLTLMIAKLHYAHHQYAKSRLFARQTVELDPDYAEAWFLLGEIAHQKDDWSGAAHHFTRAAELGPDSDKYRWHLALSLLQKGERQRAEKELEELLIQIGDLEAYIEFAIERIKEDNLSGALLLQTVLMEDLEVYLDHESSDAVWCLFPGDEKICLRKRSSKTAFSHFFYLMSLLLYGEKERASALGEAIEGGCRQYSALDSIKASLLRLSTEYRYENIYNDVRLESVKKRLENICQ